ncbi:MAG: hypothetical protein LBJ31_05235 [Treponema sp.]|jgi:hypothetical protein|nr:hypothetical protein [Treponema sp.]
MEVVVMIKKMNATGFLAVLAVLTVLSACVSQPVTRNVIDDIGGILDINRFQYYVSSDIRLTATERVREPNVDRSGTASVKETAFRDIIVINKSTMGVLMDSRTDEDGLMILEICFEEKPSDSDKRILFKQERAGSEQKFYVFYTDLRRRILKYGDVEYSLETKKGQRPFLEIKINRKEIENERIRKVKGRKVEY